MIICTRTLQVQSSQKDQYVKKKLRNTVENGTKSQDTLIELTPHSASAEISITEPVLNLKPTTTET